MTEHGHNLKKVFTLEEANAMLPLVGAIATDLARLSREVVDRRQRLSHIASDRDFASGNPYDDELAQVEKELERDTQRLREYVEELRELGVEPKGATEGLVDFPASLEGRLVHLCWRIGEPEILYWHEIEAGFAGRQPLTAGSVTEDMAGEGGVLDDV